MSRYNAPSGNRIQRSSMTEQESKSNGRRRTPVACNRCRKRKIKCSGDTGDGQGCSNCRTSGTPNCLFLRVNSSPVHARAPYGPFPCTILNSNGPLSAGGLHQGNYDTHAYSRSATLASHSNPASCSSYTLIHSGFDSGQGNGQNLIHRPSYMSTYPLTNYEDDPSYHAQQPQSHPIANSDVGDGTVFAGSTGGKSWYESYPAKALHGVFPDNNANNALAASGYPYMLQQTHTPVQTDNVSAFPVTTSLSAGLTSSDRTLPNPVGYRNSTSVSENSINTSIGLSNMSSYRQCGFDKHILSEILIPRSSSSLTNSSTPSDTSRPSPSSPSDLEYGYLPASGDLSPVAGSPPPCTASEAMRLSDRYQTIHEPRRPKAPEIYTSELYGYTTRRGARGYTATGHEYERNTVDYDSIPINRADLMPRLAPLSPRLNAQRI